MVLKKCTGVRGRERERERINEKVSSGGKVKQRKTKKEKKIQERKREKNKKGRKRADSMQQKSGTVKKDEEI